MLREYELTLITSGQLTDSQRAEVYDKYEAMVEADGGSVLKKDDWGVLKLAHPIKKQFRGHYMCYLLASHPQFFVGMEQKLKIDPDVLRYLNIKTSDSHDAEQWAAELARLAALQSASMESTDLGQVNDNDSDSGDGDNNNDNTTDNIAESPDGLNPNGADTMAEEGSSNVAHQAPAVDEVSQEVAETTKSVTVEGLTVEDSTVEASSDMDIDKT